MSQSMSIWKNPRTIAELKQSRCNTMVEHLGIELTEIGDDFLRASMPVDHRTHQPMGILHGGASLALAETVGSMAAFLAAEPGCRCVGLDINANHLRAVRSGLVIATAKPVHLGRSTQVWQIEIENEAGQAVCTSRLTMAVLRD